MITCMFHGDEKIYNYVLDTETQLLRSNFECPKCQKILLQQIENEEFKKRIRQ